MVQLNMWVNMGFYLLHRKFLRCSFAEVSRGISSSLLRWVSMVLCAHLVITQIVFQFHLISPTAFNSFDHNGAVLLFFYSLYKLGICQCVCRTLCKMAWASFATFFSIVEFGCTFLCYKLPKLKRRHRKHKRDIERFYMSSSDGEEEAAKDRRFLDHKPGKSLCRHWRDYRREHLRRSLRARSHRVTVGIRRDGFCVNKRNGAKYGNQGKNVNDIRVTRTSKFAQKRGDNKGSSRRMGRKKWKFYEGIYYKTMIIWQWRLRQWH